MNWFVTQKTIVKISIILTLLGGGTGLVFIAQNNREDATTDTEENTGNRVVKPSTGSQGEELDANSDTENISLAPNFEIGGDFLPSIVRRKPQISSITKPLNIVIPNTPTIPNTPELPIIAPASKFPVQAGSLGSIDSDSNIAELSDGSKLIAGNYRGKVVLSSNITLNSTDGDSYIAKIDNAGNYIWVKPFTTNGSGDVLIKPLPDGTSIISGYFYGQAILGAKTLTSLDDLDDEASDVYIAKVDVNGDFVWATQIGGIDSQDISNIQVQTDGSSIIVGNFNNQSIFGTTTIVSDGFFDGYIAKVGANGDFVWVRQIGGGNIQNIDGIQVQEDGSSIIVGRFYNQFIFGSTTFTSTDGQWDGYIAKVDANGDIVWARQIEGNNYQEIGATQIQDDGSIIIGGLFYGEMILGTTTLSTPHEGSDGFLVKIDTDGNYVWTHQIDGLGDQQINNIYIQEGGSIMIGGYFSTEAVVGTTTLTAMDSDSFVARLDSEGNVIWVSQIGGSGNQHINTIKLQSDGSSIVMGGFFDQITLGETTFSATSGWDGYITKVDANGGFIWSLQIGGPNSQYIHDIQVQSDNTIISIGDFDREAIIGGTHLFDASDSNRGFIAILNSDGTVNKAQNVGFGMGGSITLDGTRILADESIMIRGEFTGIVNFGDIALRADGDEPYIEQEYIAKIDKYGNYLWARSIGGFEYHNEPRIRLQDSGSTIIYGDFYDTAIIGDTIFTAPDNYRDAFIGILNTNGEYDFIRQIGGERDQWIDDVEMQADGSLIITGQFYNQAILGGITLTALDTDIDAFVAKIANNGDLLWVNQVGGAGNQYIYITEVQTDESIMISGEFTNQVISGSVTVSTTDEGWDRYIGKMDRNGNTIWLNSIGGIGNQQIDDIEAQADGSYIISGNMTPEGVFGTITLTTSDRDGYIAKIDANGDFIWSRQIGGANEQYANQVYVQADGSNIVIGTFDNEAIFGTTTLTAVAGGWDSYITKIDSNGNFVWTAQVGGSLSQYIYDVQVQTDGTTTITGTNDSNGDMILGDITLSSTGFWGDGYIAKIDVNGEFVWANRIGGFGWDTRNIVLQEDDSSIIYGDFNEPATFGVTTLTPNGGGTDAYIVKINSDGNYVWVRQIGGVGNQWVNSEERIQSDGSIIFIGEFGEQAIIGTTTLTTVDGGRDAYITKIDRDGNFVWVSQVGGIDDQEIDRFRIQDNGSVMVAGNFDKEIVFSQPGLPSQSLIRTSRDGDIYIAKLNPNGVWE